MNYRVRVFLGICLYSLTSIVPLNAKDTFIYCTANPDFHLFDSTKTTLTDGEKEKNTLLLVTAARITATGIDTHKITDPLLPSKCMALASELTPNAKSVIVTNFQFSKGIIPPIPDDAPTSQQLSADILSQSEALVKSNNEEDKKLSGYLFELAALINPLNEDAIYQMTSIQQTGFKPDWNKKLKEAEKTSTASTNTPIDNPLANTRSHNSIKILLVSEISSGQAVGLTNNMIATMQNPIPGADISATFSGTVGRQMEIASKEAARLAKIKHPNLPAFYGAMLSFEDKYTPKDGGSCATAITILLLSLIEDFDIDQNAVITGDITVDGQVQKIGGLFSKTEGALAANAKIMVMPEQNAGDIEDYLVLHPLSDLTKIQIFTATNIDEALALMKQQKDGKLNQAIEQYSELSKTLPSQGIEQNLKNQSMLAKLQEIVNLAPNHLSAKLLLRGASGSLPKKMSVQNSVDQIFMAAAPFLPELFGNRANDYAAAQITFRPYAQEICDQSARKLNNLNFKVDTQVAALQDAVLSYVQAWQTLGSLSSDRSHSGGAYANRIQEVLNARKKILTELSTLKYDQKFLDSYLRKDDKRPIDTR